MTSNFCAADPKTSFNQFGKADNRRRAYYSNTYTVNIDIHNERERRERE